MSTLQVFYTTAPESGTITLPKELRGKPLKIVVERETRETGILSIAGILKDCQNENEQLPNTSSKKGILGLRGIMKGCTASEIEDARYEYLMEKYAHND